MPARKKRGGPIDPLYTEDDVAYANAIAVVPWIIIGSLILGGVILILMPGAPSTVLGIITILMTIWLFINGWERIDANPPQMGQMTFFGTRMPKVYKEGLRFTLKQLKRFLIGIIKIEVRDQNLDFVYTHVRTCATSAGASADISSMEAGALSGLPLEIEVSLTIAPNRRRFISYVNAGGLEPSRDMTTREERTVLHDTINDMLGDYIRSKASKMTWEGMTFSQGKIALEVLEEITDVSPHKKENRVKDVLKREKGEIEDAYGYGFLVKRLNVVRIELDPDSEAVKAADSQARELLEKQGESVEVDHFIKQAKKLIQNAGTDENGKDRMDLAEALRILRLNLDKNTTEQSINISGINVEKIADSLSKRFGGTS